MNKLKQYLKLIRIHQIFKNLFIFIPFLFSKKFLQIEYYLPIILTFIAFYFASSIVYVINDLKDVEEDRLHPVKKNRPLASGMVSTIEAYRLIIFLSFSEIILIAGISLYLQNIALFGIIALYLVNNLLYNYKIKKIAYLEIISVCVGFLLRLYAGAISIGEYVSIFLFLATLFLVIFLISSKRFRELKINGTKSRKVLKYYSSKFLKLILGLSLALTILTYIAFTIFSVNHSRIFVATSIIPIVLAINFYNDIINSYKQIDDPFELFLNNKMNIATTGIWFICIILILYGQG